MNAPRPSWIARARDQFPIDRLARPRRGAVGVNHDPPTVLAARPAPLPQQRTVARPRALIDQLAQPRQLAENSNAVTPMPALRHARFPSKSTRLACALRARAWRRRGRAVPVRRRHHRDDASADGLKDAATPLTVTSVAARQLRRRSRRRDNCRASSVPGTAISRDCVGEMNRRRPTNGRPRWRRQGLTALSQFRVGVVLGRKAGSNRPGRRPDSTDLTLRQSRDARLRSRKKQLDELIRVSGG